MILFCSFLSNASTILLFLISDKSGDEMLVTQMGIYRNEKSVKGMQDGSNWTMIGFVWIELIVAEN